MEIGKSISLSSIRDLAIIVPTSSKNFSILFLSFNFLFLILSGFGYRVLSLVSFHRFFSSLISLPMSAKYSRVGPRPVPTSSSNLNSRKEDSFCKSSIFCKHPLKYYLWILQVFFFHKRLLLHYLTEPL